MIPISEQRDKCFNCQFFFDKESEKSRSGVTASFFQTDKQPDHSFFSQFGKEVPFLFDLSPEMGAHSRFFFYYASSREQVRFSYRCTLTEEGSLPSCYLLNVILPSLFRIGNVFAHSLLHRC